jgi:streptogrisin D
MFTMHALTGRRAGTVAATSLLIAALLPGPSGAAAPATVDAADGFAPYAASIAADSLAASGIDKTTATRVVKDQPAKTALAERLSRQLGARAAGAYLDARTGAVVVNVVDGAAAGTVREAGATPKTVPNRLDSLNAAIDQLNRTLKVPNTSWQIDIAGNEVVVSISDVVPATERAHVEAAAKSLGALARVETTSGAFVQKIAGGDEIIADQGWICSAGFNGTQGGQNVIVTAGHCTNGYPNWRAGNVNLGPSLNSNFPTDDMGLLRNNGSPPVAGVTLWNGSIQSISSAGNAFVGQSVCKSGRTSYVTCGQVTGLNATVDYGNGAIVYGLIQTNVYAAPGDSGGALFAGSTGLGMTSGGNSVTNFFQPLPEALSAYGVSLYGGGGGGAAKPLYGLNKCVDVQSANSNDGTPITIYDCNNTSAQQWTRVGETFQAYGKCLDIFDNGTANGAPIILWTCTNGGNQRWQFGANNSLYNPQSNRCLDIPGGDTTNGRQLVIWDCNGGDNQRFHHG